MSEDGSTLVEGAPRCLCQCAMELGEGPVWVEREQALYFVDITGRRIHRWRDECLKTWTAPAEVGFIVPRRRGGFLCGLRGGLHAFDSDSGEFEQLLPLEQSPPQHRINDGFVDFAGRLWFGTMHEDARTEGGVLYLLDGRLSVLDRGYVVTNGPAMSPDGKTLYHNDSDRQIVYAFDVDSRGTLANKRTFAKFAGRSFPDGMAVDSAGNLWIALFNGSRVEVYSAQGDKRFELTLPCTNVTKVAFGGSDRRTLYITTARIGLSDAALANEPLAGSLFAVRTRVAGLPSFEFDDELLPGD